jgi:hypothetical protein
MGTRKQFSRALYEAYDAPAKDKLVEYLVSAGHDIENAQEDYNVDIVSKKNDYTYFNVFLNVRDVYLQSMRGRMECLTSTSSVKI